MPRASGVKPVKPATTGVKPATVKKVKGPRSPKKPQYDVYAGAAVDALVEALLPGANPPLTLETLLDMRLTDEELARTLRARGVKPPPPQELALVAGLLRRVVRWNGEQWLEAHGMRGGYSPGWR